MSNFFSYLKTSIKLVMQNKYVRIYFSIMTKLIVTSLLVLCGYWSLNLDEGSVEEIDGVVNTYVKDVTIKAGSSYAILRILNGVISVIKDSDVEASGEVEVSVGIASGSGKGGADVGLGQILDPIDDMIERAESILVFVLVSIGVLKIIHLTAIIFFMKLLGCFCFVLCFSVWIKRYNHKLYPIYKSFFALLVAARLCLPASAFIGNTVYSKVILPEIERGVSELSSTSDILDQKSKELSDMKVKGIFKRILDVSIATFDTIKEYTIDIVDTLLTLAISYISLFILQVICIPIFSLLILRASLRSFLSVIGKNEVL